MNPLKFGPGRRIARASLSLLFFLLTFLPTFARTATSDNGHDYISRLRAAVEEWRQEIPALDASAAQAARSLAAGGRLYLAGTQQSFVKEAIGRSGGLVLCLPLTASVQLQAKDVVLFGAIHGDNPAILATLRQRSDAAGARLILFSTSIRPSGPHLTLFPVRPGLDAAVPRIESASNVAGLWAWFGQLIGQCVARGKTPCIYESLSMPGGTARDLPLRGVAFHTRSLAAGPDFPALGRDYLKALDLALTRLKEKNGTAFRRAAALLADTHAANRPVVIFSIGHMFPAEFRSNPVPSWINPAPPKSVPAAGTLPLYLGYQGFPWDLPLLSGPARIPSIIISSRPPTPDWPPDASHVYIDPCWEIQDAAVTVPGYDVKALPVSGVLESAIFWELLERLPSSVRAP